MFLCIYFAEPFKYNGFTLSFYKVLLFMKNFLLSKLPIYIFSLFFTPVAMAQAVESLPLTLKDAVEIVLKNNISISVASYNSKINEQFIFENQAEFDPTFDLELGIREETRQNATSLADPKRRSKDLDWDFSLTQKFVTGGDYELSMDNNKGETSSSFASLNPVYSSDMSLTVTQPLLKDFGIDLNKRLIYISQNDQKISDHDFAGKGIDTLAEAENITWDLVFSI